jgi:hypothetical protein
LGIAFDCLEGSNRIHGRFGGSCKPNGGEGKGKVRVKVNFTPDRLMPGLQTKKAAPEAMPGDWWR